MFPKYVGSLTLAIHIHDLLHALQKEVATIVFLIDLHDIVIFGILYLSNESNTNF